VVLPLLFTLSSAMSFPPGRSCWHKWWILHRCIELAAHVGGSALPELLLTMTGVTEITVLVSERCFCTSCIFWVSKLEIGFSVPSTTPVLQAW